MSSGFAVETDRLYDLARFARIELESNDLEPWAGLLGELHARGYVDYEQTLWLIKLYNAYDAFDSAFAMFDRWNSPAQWLYALDRYEAADYPCTQERRNLRGGKVVRHLEHYALSVGSAPRAQENWLVWPLQYRDQQEDFTRMTTHLRTLWGVGRQTAFEWAEFLAKAADFPIEAPNAMLWESEGPRRSLQKLYGNDHPTSQWLDARAEDCKSFLASQGVDLVWEDFETVICDFNVGRDGRYYPGRHLAALREELELIKPPWRDPLMACWYAYVPKPWCDIEPGIDKAKMPVYRDTGVILDHP